MDAQLRVSVVKNGRIVDERRVRVGEAMTIGGKGKLALPRSLAPQLAAGQPLLEHRNGRVVVRGYAGAKGVFVRRGGRPQPLFGGEDVELDDASKGYLDLVDARLLFQVEPVQVEAPKPVLPPEVRRAAPSPQSKRFTMALVAVLVAELGAIAYVRSRPPIDADGRPEVEFGSGFKQVTIVRPHVTPPPPVVAAKPEKPKKIQEVANGPVKKASPQQAQEAAKNAALLQAFGALQRGGKFPNLFAQQKGLGEIDEALAQVHERPLYAADGKPLDSRPFEPEVLGIGGISNGLGEKARPIIGEKRVENDPDRFKAECQEGVDCVQDLHPDKGGVRAEDLSGPLAKEMKLRMNAVKQCYEDAMRRHGGAISGRITLHFTVEPSGHVADVGIEESGLAGGVDEVGQCVVKRARDWKFGIRPKESFDASFPFILSQGQ